MPLLDSSSIACRQYTDTHASKTFMNINKSCEVSLKNKNQGQRERKGILVPLHFMEHWVYILSMCVHHLVSVAVSGWFYKFGGEMQCEMTSFQLLFINKSFTLYGIVLKKVSEWFNPLFSGVLIIKNILSVEDALSICYNPQATFFSFYFQQIYFILYMHMCSRSTGPLCSVPPGQLTP